MGHDNWNIVKSINGLDMILLSRGKNGQESNIPITKDLKQVIEKLKFYGGDRLFPFPIFVNHLNYKEKNNRLYDRSYANYRNFLSRMAKKLRWKKNVKSHTLRHTFAMVMLNKYKICLLYTSPSPRDRQKSRMPSSA